MAVIVSSARSAEDLAIAMEIMASPKRGATGDWIFNRRPRTGWKIIEWPPGYETSIVNPTPR